MLLAVQSEGESVIKKRVRPFNGGVAPFRATIARVKITKGEDGNSRFLMVTFGDRLEGISSGTWCHEPGSLVFKTLTITLLPKQLHDVWLEFEEGEEEALAQEVAQIQESTQVL